jgi:hypothetical protein
MLSLIKKRRVPVGTLILTFLPILCVLIASGWYWYSTLYPSPPSTSCGSVVRNLSGFDSQTASEAEDCFSQAFQHCQTISLTYAESGTDTVANYQFWPVPRDGLCNVQGKLTNHVNSSEFIRYLTCTTVQKRTGGLLISGCGTNTNAILIPK